MSLLITQTHGSDESLILDWSSCEVWSDEGRLGYHPLHAEARSATGRQSFRGYHVELTFQPFFAVFFPVLTTCKPRQLGVLADALETTHLEHLLLADASNFGQRYRELGCLLCTLILDLGAECLGICGSCTVEKIAGNRN
jgi:hypothetical protein